MELKKSDKANLERKKGVFFQVGLVITLSLILIAFEWTSRPPKDSTLGALGDVDVQEEIIPITRQEQEPPPPPPPPPAQITELEIVQNDVELNDELVLDDIEANQNTAIKISDFVEQADEAAEEQVFVVVEDMPLFNGKEASLGFREYISQNLKYPEIAAENNVEGRVIVQFAVNSKGEVVNARVVRGVDAALDKEALRVVNSSPKWTPGKQRGSPVSVQFTFPISFQLQ